MEGVSYNTATPMATSTSVISTGMTVRGTGATTGSTMTGTPTTLLSCLQISSFLSCLYGGVLFYKLTIPTTEHFADLVDFY